MLLFTIYRGFIRECTNIDGSLRIGRERNQIWAANCRAQSTAMMTKRLAVTKNEIDTSLLYCHCPFRLWNKCSNHFADCRKSAKRCDRAGLSVREAALCRCPRSKCLSVLPKQPRTTKTRRPKKRSGPKMNRSRPIPANLSVPITNEFIYSKSGHFQPSSSEQELTNILNNKFNCSSERVFSSIIRFHWA